MIRAKTPLWRYESPALTAELRALNHLILEFKQFVNSKINDLEGDLKLRLNKNQIF